METLAAAFEQNSARLNRIERRLDELGKRVEAATAAVLDVQTAIATLTSK